MEQGCPECGRELSGDEKFCTGCGHELTSSHPSVCPECDQELSGDERYCPGCGHDLDTDTQSETDDESLVSRRATLGMLGVGVVGLGGGWMVAQMGGNNDDESAAGTVPTDTPTETVTPTGSEQPILVDSFEDGDTSGWTPVAELTSTFEASQERAKTGSWSAKFTEGDASDNPRWERVGGVARPDRIETAHALENGEIFADSNTEWYLGDTFVFRVNYNWSNNFISVNGQGSQPNDIEDGAVVADLPWPSSEDFFHVVLDKIDWVDHMVGEVKVNGTVQAEGVPFFNEADGIDRAAVSIGGDGGNVMFIDNTTVPAE